MITLLRRNKLREKELSLEENLKVPVCEIRILRWNDWESFEAGAWERQDKQLESMRITVKGMLIKLGPSGCLGACRTLLHIWSSLAPCLCLVSSLLAVQIWKDWILRFRLINTWERWHLLFSWYWAKKKHFEKREESRTCCWRLIILEILGGFSQAKSPWHPSY